jgi:hypothetical protein
MITEYDRDDNPIAWVEMKCTGTNAACKEASREGRRVHIIPHHEDPRAAAFTLALPTYHFATEVDAVKALEEAWNWSAETANTADERDAAYARGVPVKIAKGVRRP